MRGSAKTAAVVMGVMLLVVSFGVGGAAAQATNWLSTTSVRDLTGSQTLQTGSPLVAGHTYNVTFAVNVPLDQTSPFYLELAPGLAANSSQFWYLHSSNYAGYNRSIFNPALTKVGFEQVEGTVSMSVVFRVPNNMTTVSVNPTNSSGAGITLHFEKSINLVTATVPKTADVVSVAGSIGMSVVDQSIQTYQDLYQSRSGMITSAQVSSSYATLLGQVLNLSQTLYNEGLTDQAASLLNSVAPSNLPGPPNASYVSYVLIAAILLAVLAASLAILYIRKRGKHGFSVGLINEINRELASLEVVAGRYDRALADQLKALREKLTEAT